MALFKSDGCSWFPDLWFKHCCDEHDFSYFSNVPRMTADTDFMNCIAHSSHFLGAAAFLFAGVIVTGMALGRPIRNKVKKMLKKA